MPDVATKGRQVVSGETALMDPTLERALTILAWEQLWRMLGQNDSVGYRALTHFQQETHRSPIGSPGNPGWESIGWLSDVPAYRAVQQRVGRLYDAKRAQIEASIADERARAAMAEPTRMEPMTAADLGIES